MEMVVVMCYVCKFFCRNMQLLELIIKRIEEQSLYDVLFELSKMVLCYSGSLIRDNFLGFLVDIQDYGLIIDGVVLFFIMKFCEDGSFSNYREFFLEICWSCSVVFCCCMVFLQKVQIVKLIKFLKEYLIMLVVGDGVNDVSMILEVYVGIGVIGKEGCQVVRNSDYVILKFKYLKKMLFVYGYFYYIRIFEFVQYFFYKNVCFIFFQFLYQFFCGFL